MPTYTPEERIALVDAYYNESSYPGADPGPSNKVTHTLIDLHLVAFSESRGCILTPWGEYEACRLIEECPHAGTKTERFGGAVVCDDCYTIVGSWRED